MKRLLAIAVIWLGCAVAWMVLGSTVLWRTNESSSALLTEVHGLWGPQGVQAPPRAAFQKQEITEEVVVEQTGSAAPTKKTLAKATLVTVPIVLDASDISVKLALEHRRKGLMWFPTYEVDFHGVYTFLNDSAEAQDIRVWFPLEASQDPEGRGIATSASFDGFTILDDTGKAVEFAIESGTARFIQRFEAGARKRYTVSYRTRGTSSWRYALTQGTGRVRNLRLLLQTDFPNIDFPANALSPTKHGPIPGGWRGEWKFSSLISAAPIAVELPQLLNPGPLASKVTFFAPVSLLFFFFVVAMLAKVREREMHALHYFLLGCAFFAFHLLFAYLVDHVPLVPSFAIASLVSMFLVISYARLFVGWKFALREMGIAQFVYLVLFSASFFWSGFTGLAITLGAVLTLFFVMQVTGRSERRHAQGASLATSGAQA